MLHLGSLRRVLFALAHFLPFLLFFASFCDKAGPNDGLPALLLEARFFDLSYAPPYIGMITSSFWMPKHYPQGLDTDDPLFQREPSPPSSDQQKEATTSCWDSSYPKTVS